MDQEVVRFREAADRENRGRRAIRRRYSPTLQQHAVDYWHTRRPHGEGLRAVAAALGIAPWSLHRWTHRLTARPSFRPVRVIETTSAAPVPSVVVTLTSVGPRVEGLDVETAARLLTLLR